MVVRLVAIIVARGGVLSVDGDRLVCRLPKGAALLPEVAAEIRNRKEDILAALAVAPLGETVRSILALSAAERSAYQAALAHDLAALAAAEAMIAAGGEGAVR